MRTFQREHWLPINERRPLRYVHISKRFQFFEGRLFYARGETYNIGANQAKRLKRARRAAGLR